MIILLNTRPIHVKIFVVKEASIRCIRFHRAEITYFKLSTLYAYHMQIICKGVHF